MDATLFARPVGQSRDLQNLMPQANAEAGKWQHDYVGTEHLLLGLLRDRRTIGSLILESLKIQPNTLKQALEKVLQRGPARSPTHVDCRTLTPEAARVFDLALEEARRIPILHDPQTSNLLANTGHLLAAFFLEQGCIAAQVLTNAGVDVEKVREELRNPGGVNRKSHDLSLVRDFCSSGVLSKLRPDVQRFSQFTPLARACLIVLADQSRSDKDMVSAASLRDLLHLALQDPELAELEGTKFG